MDFLTRFALFGAAVLFAAWLAIRGGRWLARQLAAMRPYLAAFLVFTFVAMNYAQKGSGTNEPPQGASPPMLMMGGGIAQSVSAHDAAHGYLLESETTNETYLYAMPTNGMRRENWWLRGAYEDVFRLDLGGLLFPLGTNLCDSLWIYTWGVAGARLGDVSNRIVATGVPMSAVPGFSQFWIAETDGGGRLLTWQDFALNRDTSTPVSAQLELMPSGDFIARSNLVERLYRRVNPDDWDDDGIPNDADLNPLAYDGDNFGPHQTLPEGANSNAYCWVDLVVPDANAIVTFTGDGYSALPDPVFVARAGDTNRVILLIGKTYQVTSRMPMSCIGQSNCEIEVDQVSATELQIVWPVEIECVVMRSGVSFAMTVAPDCLGGGFTWTNGCCAVVSLGGWRYGFTCAENCLCSGCGTQGYYGYEAYRIHASGGSCGCSPHGDDDGGGDDEEPPEVGVSVSFSKDAVIFEDAYVPSPGESVQKRSTTVKLRVSACGGPHGGTVSFTPSNLDKLSPLACGPILLPSNLVLSPMATYSEEFQCEGSVASAAANDVVVTGSFVENVTGSTYDAQDRITVFRVEIQKVIGAPRNDMLNRHKFGVREQIRCNVAPSNAGLVWTSAASGNVDSNGIYRCSLYAIARPLTATLGDTYYIPFVTVVEPSGIEARNPRRVTYGARPGRAGWVGLRQEFYVTPLDVSFSQIMMEEVPCTTGGHDGYFADPAFSVIWCHSTANGAGRWLAVNVDNRMGAYDTAALTMELLRVKPDGSPTFDESYGWADGWITWDVPFGWTSPEAVAANGHADPFREFDPHAGHRFLITTNGTVTVRKFGNEAVRAADEDTSSGGGGQ